MNDAAFAKPSAQAVSAAVGTTVPDIIGPGLDVVFCGINPSAYSAAVGHHFARPGNRFWKALFFGGFTERVYEPFEDRGLLSLGLGLTNIVSRASVAASDLAPAELRLGAHALEEKLLRYRPRVLAVLGIGAYRQAFSSQATFGRQSDPLGGAVVFVLPNPSGLQARYQLPELAEAFAAVREALGPEGGVSAAK